VEQWHGEVVLELKECKTDDSGDEDGEEKVEKVEKEVYTYKLKSFIESYLFSSLNLKKISHLQNDSFISELFVSLPDLPPEA
jgi:hypothetical protein